MTPWKFTLLGFATFVGSALVSYGLISYVGGIVDLTELQRTNAELVQTNQLLRLEIAELGIELEVCHDSLED